MTCAGCGCVCDDGRLCPLGEAWLELGDRPPIARVDGAETSLEEAVGVAAGILSQARAPLVHGLGRVSCEAQREAVALAERYGATIDPGGGSPWAYQALGASTATFGEIRDRAELVFVVAADPAVTHPRLLERLRVTPEPLDASFEAMWELRSRLAGSPAAAAGVALPSAGGSPSLSALAERLRDARHVAFLHGALDQLAAFALAALVRDLNRERHAVTLALRRDGNARGAEDVIAWQTGFAGAVSFARGHPRESPPAAELLARGEVDAVLAIETEPPAAIPAIVVGARVAAPARVALATAADGVEAAGTVHRMDGVPVPLRPPRAGDRPSVQAVLTAIAAHA